MNRRFLAAALAVLTLSCAKREEPRRISADAAAAFGRATAAEGPGGSLVLDVDALRELGFRGGEGRAADGSVVVDLAVELLPAMAVELEDDAASAALARAAVLLRLAGEWAKAPEVQRLAVVAAVDPLKPEEAADGALVLLAVRGGEAENQELLQGLGASIRAASGRDLVKAEAGNLCIAREATPELPFQACLRAAPGLLALGTPKALASLAQPSGAPAAREPGPVVHVRARVPELGRMELLAEGRGALKVSAVLEPENPELAKQLEKGIRTGLDALDMQAQRQRLVMARALEEVQGSLAKDPDAPARLKSAAAAATIDKVLDPRGEYAALRRSIQVANTGKAVTVELTVPEAQVRRIAQMEQGLTTIGAVGVLSAIAIPNFLKYQCRAKSAEGAATLKAAWAAMEAARAKRGRFPTSLAQLDYRPPPGGRFALCMRSGCSAAASTAAASVCAEVLAGGSQANLLCAAGEVGEGGGLDVWLVDASGDPAHVRFGCR